MSGSHDGHAVDRHGSRNPNALRLLFQFVRTARADAGSAVPSWNLACRRNGVAAHVRTRKAGALEDGIRGDVARPSSRGRDRVVDVALSQPSVAAGETP